MRILMLVNWKIKYCEKKPSEVQPPDYYVEGELYWFYRYFNEHPEVDVIDVSSFPCLENIEKNKIRFYIWQSIRAILKLHKYDLIVSHGMQSGVVLSFWRRLFKTKAKHIVFDIGSFNSAAESGFALKLMQFASKSIDGLIYHTSSQIHYYKKIFPWLVEKSKFIKFGTDLEFFNILEKQETVDENPYIICVGYSKRDWDTLIEAYKRIKTDVKLRLVGHVDNRYKYIQGVEQMPFMSIKELISQIQHALFCVLPLESFNYSYGQMTLMQQMALGKCVIAASVPSLLDYTEDGKTAIMYRAKDVNDLTRKMRIVLENKIVRKDIEYASKIFLQQNCNENIMALQIEEFYKHILERL